MQRGGGGHKKPCGFIGAHKQAAGRGGTGGKRDLAWSERFLSPLHSFSNIKSGPESLHTNQGGGGFTGGVSAPDSFGYIA